MTQDPLMTKLIVNGRLELQQEEEAYRLHQEERRLKTNQRSSSYRWIVRSISMAIIFFH